MNSIISVCPIGVSVCVCVRAFVYMCGVWLLLLLPLLVFACLRLTFQTNISVFAVQCPSYTLCVCLFHMCERLYMCVYVFIHVHVYVSMCVLACVCVHERNVLVFIRVLN